MTMKRIAHPGINYFIKHIGTIFRRLLYIAIEGAKQGDELSAILKVMPSLIEAHIVMMFDEMVSITFK